MAKKLRLTLTDAQWVELKARASSQRTNPATMIKRLLFPKAKAVEKRGTLPCGHALEFEKPVPFEGPERQSPRWWTRDEYYCIKCFESHVDAPTIPVSCSFCDDTGFTWLAGNQVPCPKCGWRVEVSG